MVLKIFQDVGGAHPTTWYKAFTYDLGQRKPVTFDTLFPAGTKPLDVIFPIVQRELERQTGLTGVISTGDGMDPSHYQNFADHRRRGHLLLRPGRVADRRTPAPPRRRCRATSLPPLQL